MLQKTIYSQLNLVLHTTEITFVWVEFKIDLFGT